MFCMDVDVMGYVGFDGVGVGLCDSDGICFGYDGVDV